MRKYWIVKANGISSSPVEDLEKAKDVIRTFLTPRGSDGERRANRCYLILVTEDATEFVPSDLENGNLEAF